MFCPNCGVKIDEGEIKWEQKHKYIQPRADINCSNCDTKLLLEDRTSYDQEGFIDVIFH